MRTTAIGLRHVACDVGATGIAYHAERLAGVCRSHVASGCPRGDGSAKACLARHIDLPAVHHLAAVFDIWGRIWCTKDGLARSQTQRQS